MYQNSSQSSSDCSKSPGVVHREGHAPEVSRMAHRQKRVGNRFESSKERSEAKYGNTPWQCKSGQKVQLQERNKKGVLMPVYQNLGVKHDICTQEGMGGLGFSLTQGTE